MTLLRLHSFSRHAVSEVGEPEKKKPLNLPDESRPESDRADRDRSGRSEDLRGEMDLGVPIERSGTTQSASEAVGDTSVPVGPAPGLAFGDWPSVLDRLGLSGMVRALAQNCELAFANGDRIELRLSPVHRHLLTRAAQDRMQQAIASQTGVARTVVITLAETRGETPAAQTDRARKADRELAIEAVEGDQAVREIIELLDATVIESSISLAADGESPQFH
jgi:DNA polymerase III subunit gamma/tau